MCRAFINNENNTSEPEEMEKKDASRDIRACFHGMPIKLPCSFIKLELEGIRSFNLDTKHMQLLSLQIPGTCILIVESQDCDECQITWLADQVKFGSQVYFVGDAAQTIYYFRGVNPKCLMSYR